MQHLHLAYGRYFLHKCELLNRKACTIMASRALPPHQSKTNHLDIFHSVPSVCLVVNLYTLSLVNVTNVCLVRFLYFKQVFICLTGPPTNLRSGLVRGLPTSYNNNTLIECKGEPYSTFCPINTLKLLIDCQCCKAVDTCSSISDGCFSKIRKQLSPPP